MGLDIPFTQTRYIEALSQRPNKSPFPYCPPELALSPLTPPLLRTKYCTIFYHKLALVLCQVLTWCDEFAAFYV